MIIGIPLALVHMAINVRLCTQRRLAATLVLQRPKRLHVSKRDLVAPPRVIEAGTPCVVQEECPSHLSYVLVEILMKRSSTFVVLQNEKLADAMKPNTGSHAAR